MIQLGQYPAASHVVAHTGLSITSVQAVLGALQLEGVAVERASGWVKAG